MFNAEDIIELEKKWSKYKLKRQSKIFASLSLFLIITSFIAYNIFIEKPKEPKKIENTIINEAKQQIKKIYTIEKNITIAVVKDESNITESKISVPSEIDIKKIDSKPYHFKLESTNQGSELFSSNGFLTLSTLNNKEEMSEGQDNIVNYEQEIIQPIRETQTTETKNKVENKQVKISIDMQEVDTITYLKDKYYTTSSIVFALMLAEEYYYEKEYDNSLKWALIANDTDAQNTKSWYWFAKSKVQLNQQDDAIKALKAYLSNNSSKSLNTLLHKIELGDTDD